MRLNHHLMRRNRELCSLFYWSGHNVTPYEDVENVFCFNMTLCILKETVATHTHSHTHVKTLSSTVDLEDAANTDGPGKWRRKKKHTGSSRQAIKLGSRFAAKYNSIREHTVSPNQLWVSVQSRLLCIVWVSCLSHGASQLYLDWTSWCQNTVNDIIDLIVRS